MRDRWGFHLALNFGVDRIDLLMLKNQTSSLLFFKNPTKVRNFREKLIAMILFGCGIFSILVTIGIILFSEAIGFFLRPEVNLITFFTGTTWRPLASKVSPDNFGVLPLILGTMMIAVISGAIAIPLGLGSAIFLSEYASDRVRGVLKPLLEILAGIPTVVYGYFALSFITPILKSVLEDGLGIKVSFFNAFSASVVVGIMIIPIITSISEDAMR